MKAEEEARLVEDSSQESNDHDHEQLKVEEGVRLTLKTRRRAEEEDLGINSEESRLKYES